MKAISYIELVIHMHYIIDSIRIEWIGIGCDIMEYSLSITPLVDNEIIIALNLYDFLCSF